MKIAVNTARSMPVRRVFIRDAQPAQSPAMMMGTWQVRCKVRPAQNRAMPPVHACDDENAPPRRSSCRLLRRAGERVTLRAGAIRLVFRAARQEAGGAPRGGLPTFGGLRNEGS